MLKIGYRCLWVAGLLLMFTGTICAGDKYSPDGYETHINRLIEKCENKKMYRHSQSNELRKLAALSTMKSAYLREFKLELINEMARKQVENQDYKIQLFINRKFFNIARNQ